MEIIEYSSKYQDDIKKLLCELQEYIVSIDPYHFNIIGDDYKDKIYEKDMNCVLKNDGKIYLAIEDNKVIGMILGIIEKPEYDFDYERKTKVGHVLELIVTKKVRNNGVGSKLLKRMEEYFFNKDCYTINIDVFGYNIQGRKFYEKNGYHARMVNMSKQIKK